MAGLEEVQSQPKERRKKNYTSVQCKDKFSSVSVPVGPTSAEMRVVRVYAESTRSLFISLSDIDWVLTFVKDESDNRFGLDINNDTSESESEDALQASGVKIHFASRDTHG